MLLNTTLRILRICLSSGLLSSSLIIPVLAQELHLITEEDAPFNFTKADGSLSGFTVEVVQEIQRRLLVAPTTKASPIQVFPWQRAYQAILDKPNTVVFPMTRMIEREELFQWVGPMIEFDWVLIGKKSSKIHLKSVDEAKKLRTIGMVRGHASARFFLERGFHNLDFSQATALNVRKLNAGRFDAYCSTELSYLTEITQEGSNPEDYEILLRLNTAQMYIAHSKTTNPAIVAQWQTTINQMKNDGKLLSIIKKWFPTSKLPRAARLAIF